MSGFLSGKSFDGKGKAKGARARMARAKVKARRARRARSSQIRMASFKDTADTAKNWDTSVPTAENAQDEGRCSSGIRGQ